MSEDKYQPCPCGSGKKFKFCCYRSLDESSERDQIRRAAEFPIHECFISSGWEERGLAQVFVVRQLPNRTYLLGIYLVDVFCLGVKNTFVRARLQQAEVRSLLDQVPERTSKISYEEARSVILGAVEFARRFGIEPHPDWAVSGPLVEPERSFDRAFEFGKDGKPFYIQGPHDDAEAIMRRLSPLVREGRAHFLTVTDLNGRGDELEDDDDGSFEDWQDDISLLLEEKRFTDAREEIEDMMKEYPESWQPLFLMGTCLAVEGKPDRAIPFLTRAISRHPCPEAYNNLGAAHKALLHIEEWVDCLKKVIDLDGKRGDYGRSAMADLNAFASQIQKTEGLTLDRYLENHRCFAQAFAHLKAGRFEAAIQGFAGVLKVAPGNVQSHGNIGLAYAGMGDRDRAIAHLDKAIELDPNYQPAIDNRRILLASPAGERLNPDAIREIRFYEDQAREGSRQTSTAAHTS